MHVIPMPSPRGTNCERLYLRAPTMAFDAQPAGFRRYRPYQQAGRDDIGDLDHPEGEETNARLDQDDLDAIEQFLASRLEPADMDELNELVADARLRRRARDARRRTGQDEPPPFRSRPRLAGDSALDLSASLAEMFPGFYRLKQVY